MLHRLTAASRAQGPYAEAVTRLAAIRRALRLADPHGAGPASDWGGETEARLDEIVGAAAAGLTALAAVDQQTASVPAEAGLEMVDRIRRELAAISAIVLR